MSSNERIIRKGSQYLLAGFPVLGLPDEERGTKYFSLNPYLPNENNRCPLQCRYCVCHQDSAWHHHPARFDQLHPPADLNEILLDRIFATREGEAGVPISLCDYSDPFIRAHRDRVLDLLASLIERDASNLVYITTKMHPGLQYLHRLCGTLARSKRLRITVFVSLPPLKQDLELVSIENRVRLIKDLSSLGIPTCWYLRPMTPEWFDDDLLSHLARELLPVVAPHVILSGLILAPEIEASLRMRNLPVPRKLAPRKQLDPKFEHYVRARLAQLADELDIDLGPVMGHRLCGTNANHAYGCLQCGKQARYCQLYQQHRFGSIVNRR